MLTRNKSYCAILLATATAATTGGDLVVVIVVMVVVVFGGSCGGFILGSGAACGRVVNVDRLVLVVGGASGLLCVELVGVLQLIVCHVFAFHSCVRVCVCARSATPAACCGSGVLHDTVANVLRDQAVAAWAVAVDARRMVEALHVLLGPQELVVSVSALEAHLGALQHLLVAAENVCELLIGPVGSYGCGCACAASVIERCRRYCVSE